MKIETLMLDISQDCDLCQKTLDYIFSDKTNLKKRLDKNDKNEVDIKTTCIYKVDNIFHIHLVERP